MVVGKVYLWLTGESSVVVLDLFPEVALHAASPIFEVLSRAYVDGSGLDSPETEVAKLLENPGCINYSVSSSKQRQMEFRSV